MPPIAMSDEAKRVLIDCCRLAAVVRRLRLLQGPQQLAQLRTISDGIAIILDALQAPERATPDELVLAEALAPPQPTLRRQ